jgi:hypothetical protein
VIETIVTTWASPSTTLDVLRDASDLTTLLNATPPSGEPVLPALVNYLATINEMRPLVNVATRNAGYLERALYAIQEPSSENGAITLDDGTERPAYVIATPLEAILKGLEATDSTATMKLSMTRRDDQHYSVTQQGGPSGKKLGSTTLPTASLCLKRRGDSCDVLAEQIITGSIPTNITGTFPGVTMVNFGPVEFSAVTGKSWYWPQAIKQAIDNGNKDVSGYQFRPDPQVDFSRKGSFGFLTGVAISKLPIYQVEMKDTNISLQKFASKNWDLNFLGQGSSPSSGYTCTLLKNKNSAGLLFEPASTLTADLTDLRAFVLGVRTNYPFEGTDNLTASIR